MVKLIIADDHVIVRKGLIQILQMEESLNLDTIDEADSGEEVLEKIRKTNYDLIILDISMPGKGGIDTLKEIKIQKPNLPVLILSTHSEEQYAIRVLKAGAVGYVKKNCKTEELIKAIHNALHGKKYFSEAIAESLLNISQNKLPHEQLSDREYDVLIRLALGVTQTEIANELFLSVKTVNTYRKRILEKMNMSSNKELTNYCLNNNLMSDETM